MKMQTKKSGSKSPDIIATFKFETAASVSSFEQFANYTDREAAVIVDQVEKAFEEHHVDVDFEKMVAYMKRDTAVSETDERRTGLFDGHSNSLTTSEVEVLKEKLSQAQLMGNNLWVPVFSFDVAFMIQAGVLEYDPELEARIDRLDKIFKAAEQEEPKNHQKIYQAKTALGLAAKERVVNQDLLKSIVQNNMGNFLKAEGFNDDAFWWGSVHLNTKHIHIHVSFSEEKNSRKRVVNKYTGMNEPRGKLRNKSIERLKSKLYHSLLKDEDKALRVMKEMKVGQHRQAILEKVDPIIEGVKLSATNLLQFYLEHSYKRLPKDGKWRYGSNRKDFKEAKVYLKAAVEEYLRTDGKSSYEAFVDSTNEQLKSYQDVYQSDPSRLEEALVKRQEKLKEDVANRFLKSFKDRPPELTKQGDAVDYLNSKELEKVVDDLQESKLSKQEIGQYKWQLKVSYAEADEQFFKKQDRELDRYETLEINRDLKDFAKDSFKEQAKLAHLRQTANPMLSKTDQESKVALHDKYVPPRQIPISKAEKPYIDKRLELVEREKQILKNTKDPDVIKQVYGTDKKQALKNLDDSAKILTIKQAINENNKSGSKQANRPLFEDLKKIYGEDSTIQNRQEHHRNIFYKTEGLRPRFPMQQSHTKQETKPSAEGWGKALQNSSQASRAFEAALNNLMMAANDEQRAARRKRRSDEEEDRGR